MTDILHVDAASQRLIGSNICASDLSVVVASSGARLVDAVSLDLNPGEVFGLVGESGSGKTTLALSMLGYCRAGLSISNGSIRIGDTDVLALGAEERGIFRRNNVAYVPQDPATALNPSLKLGFQLRESFGSRRPTKAELAQSLSEVQLPTTSSFLDRYPHQLSGGQQQRVTIAMAFASRPKLIVMDEPTTGLDVTIQAQILENVRNLCAVHGTAVLYVSHDLAVVRSLTTKVAVMYAGRMVEFGPTVSVLASPRHPYTRALIEAVPDLNSKFAIRGIPGHAPAPSRAIVGCAFADRCDVVLPCCREGDVPSRTTGNHVVSCHNLREPVSKPSALAREKIQAKGSESITLGIQNLAASYGSLEVLHGISLNIPNKCCVALVGGSGSGKTTLARCIAGLHENMSGILRMDGKILAKAAQERPKSIRRAIQYIFQNPYASFNPRRTVGASLATPLKLFENVAKTEIDDRVANALKQVALPADHAGHYPYELSGGQRQRAAIARALIVEPELLVCDEITSALDVSVQATIVELLKRLQEERQISMIFVTHNIALVANLAQEIAVMHGGIIVEHENCDKLIADARHEVTKNLIKNVPNFYM